MKRNLFIFLALSLLVSSCYISEKAFDKLDQKINSRPIAAQYSGGHHFYITLVLYKDNSFFYISIPDFMGIATTRKGKYIMDSTSLTLQGRRRWTTLFLKKPRPETFRVKKNKILMFSEEDEQSDDSSYHKAYHTLSLDK